MDAGARPVLDVWFAGYQKKDGSRAGLSQNYQFFGPGGPVLHRDRDMELGSGSSTVCSCRVSYSACEQVGEHAQRAFCPYHDDIMPLLGAPEDQMMVCGMSLGYPQRDALINSYRTQRLEAGDFTRFVDD